jgi:DNA-binding CsgD family transcriptional regulator
MKATAAHQRIVTLCRENSDSRALRAAVLEEVRRLIAFEAYAWLLTDPETCVGSAPLANVPDITRLPQLIRLKYATAVNRWTTLKPNSCVTLAEATAADLSRSLLWKNLLSAYDVTDVASIVFRDQFGCWGFLDLWRLGGSPPQFTEPEKAFLASLAPDLTAALRGCQAATFTGPPPSLALSGPLVLLLSGQLELLDQTPRTDAHLRLLLPTSPGVAPVPAAAYNVAAQLLAVEDNVDNGPPEARAQLAGAEWITLRAARLGVGAARPGEGAARPGVGAARPGEGAAGHSDAGTIAVTIEPITARARLELYGRAAGLTPRERELLHQLARGTSTRQLARDMRLSPHTVQDHLKSVFSKTDTSSRSSLLARALGTEAG